MNWRIEVFVGPQARESMYAIDDDSALAGAATERYDMRLGEKRVCQRRTLGKEGLDERWRVEQLVKTQGDSVRIVVVGE